MAYDAIFGDSNKTEGTILLYFGGKFLGPNTEKKVNVEAVQRGFGALSIN